MNLIVDFKDTGFMSKNPTSANKMSTLKFGVLSLTYQILGKFGCKTINGPFFYASNRRFFLRIGIKWAKHEIFGYFKSFFARVDR